MLRAVDRTPLSERAYQRLLEAIVRGRLAPGQRLRDVDLALELGTSRTPVREALRRLEDEGLVESVPGSHTRVAALDPDSAAEAFPVVAALQALAARLGVGSLTSAAIKAMETADARRTRALERGDVVAAIGADDRFHQVLVDAAGNFELNRVLARLMPKIRRLDLLHFSQLEPEPSAEHADILEACRRGDARLAAALVEENFLALGRRLGDGFGSSAQIAEH